MAEEEKKEVVAQEEPRQESGMTPQSRSALTAFILSIIGFVVAWGPVVSVAGIILGAISLGTGKKNNPETEQQPFRTFGKIAKPVGIVDIIAGAGMTIFWIVYLIVVVIAAAIAAANA
jgi:hypothetical protein